MWSCPKCSESSEDNFDSCWKCGTKRDGTPAVESFENLAEDKAATLPATRSLRCLRCSGQMQQGFITEENRRGIVPATWVAGAPEPSFWSGTNISGKEQRQISTFRCEDCGYLESYAL